MPVFFTVALADLSDYQRLTSRTLLTKNIITESPWQKKYSRNTKAMIDKHCHV